MSFTRRKKTRGKRNEKTGYLGTKTNSLLYLIPAYHRSTPLAVLVPPFLLITYPITLPSKFLNRFHPPSPCHGCVSITLSPLTLASWQSSSCSLKRDTLREREICAHTKTIGNRRSFIAPFIGIDPPSLPPTTLDASWSVKQLPSTPRRPTLSTAKVVSL